VSAVREKVARRGLGSPALFAVVYTSIAAAIYFALGVVADNALGLTPVVFLAGGVMFALTAMTYVEGASLHQDRAGATVFARYAFNELVSFVAAWAVILDFLILIAITAYSTSHYLAALWAGIGEGFTEIAMALAVIAYVGVRNVLGFSRRRTRRIAALVIADLVLHLVIIVLGVVLVVDASGLIEQVELGSAPTWTGLIFALTLTTVAFTSLESASGLAGEVGVGRRGLRRLVTAVIVTVLVLYVGIAVVAVAALPVVGGVTALGTDFLDAPLVGVVGAYEPAWLGDALR
jgi:basic amino acid/polyamine antiporter, APA family